ncbi:PRTRC system protein E [Epilithonimonas vandammei]|jgi:PRTRC genetic system protein E|uniref:Prtrc system protein e n=2 Tax=Flavobacteriales TaxID=200644 RepID=A0A2U8QTX2_9FLAO|nr:MULTISPECIES: PRTRC system protein E [Bacteroidota]MBF01269.1 prtrc system protein e [Flavobacterium sp.]HBI89096.1 prtrc system protein e [Sphingobacterium sp.]AWM13316.1 prtrc system protein e [Flavobacterium sediminis]AZI56041.1 PRTRC system protein E [Epilithonimonas vandammei]MBS5795408.1 PRTRC system protein E [Dysgonomonas mossii]|tara:strand:+ start:47714 stop:48325 length:612 start_codon:yes stop_codon:yes gene_type:complete
MNTNFFNQIQQLDFTGVLQLNISKGVENNLIVSIILNNEQCGDSAKNLIPPLTFNATPQEFDEGFFQQITAPIQTVSGLMVDMEAFMKQMEAVKMQSEMEKQKAEKAKKEKEAKDKKYKDGMAKVDELEKEGKFREAWMKVPDITEFPEKADEIRKRKTSLSDKFATPSLFGAMEEPTAEPLQTVEATADYPIDEADENEEQY